MAEETQCRGWVCKFRAKEGELKYFFYPIKKYDF